MYSTWALHLFLSNSIQLFVSGCCCFCHFPSCQEIYGKSERFICFRAMGLFGFFSYFCFHFTSRCYCSSLCLLSLKICCFFIIILIKRAILQHLASFILKRGNATSFSDYVFETFTDKLIPSTHTKTTQRKKNNKMFIRYGEFDINLSGFSISKRKLMGF